MTSTPFSKLKWWPYENLRITRVNNWSDSTSSNPHHSLLTHYSLSQLINSSDILTGVTPAFSLRSWTICTTSSLNKQDCSSLHLADINCISPHSLLNSSLAFPSTWDSKSDIVLSLYRAQLLERYYSGSSVCHNHVYLVFIYTYY